MDKPSRKKHSDIKPTEKQIIARKKFAEQAKNRAGFKLEVKVNDNVLTCKTKDLEGAFKELGKQIKIVKTRAKIRVERGSKSCEKLLFVPQVKRLFKNGIYRKLFVKHLILK